ncbi:Transcriptional regulator, LuxR family (fragment) [Serratia proteamaculans]
MTLRELAPCGFYHTEYYRNFYRMTGGHDEAGVLLPLTLLKSVARLHGEVKAAPWPPGCNAN